MALPQGRDIYVEAVLARIPLIRELEAARNAVGTPAWIVGGAVRDLILQRPPLDVDIATQHPEPLARHFAASIGASVVVLDPENGVWRVALRGGRFFDFCRFRREGILGDLRGRDFTFNAMALRLPEGGKPAGLLDPFHGVDDLNRGLLRMVDSGAFRDDPARILRAFRFIADLQLALDDATRDALQAQAPKLAGVAVERLLAEWWKLCGGTHAAAAVRAMSDAGVLTYFLPELQATKGVTQNAYHHLDVWEHALLAMAEMTRLLREPDAVLGELTADFAPLLEDDHRRARLACIALLHDIGKAQTRTVKAGRVHFYGHELAGERLAARIAARLRMSRRDCYALTHTIANHMRPLFLVQHDGKGVSRKAMVGFFTAVADLWPEVLLLALADKAAARGPQREPDFRARQLALFRTLLAFQREIYQPAQEHPLLTGADLLALGLPPGPRIGDLLDEAHRQQLLGTLTTREKAQAWAERQAGKV
jgi:poly(A) polymerase